MSDFLEDIGIKVWDWCVNIVLACITALVAGGSFICVALLVAFGLTMVLAVAAILLLMAGTAVAGFWLLFKAVLGL